MIYLKRSVPGLVHLTRLELNFDNLTALLCIHTVSPNICTPKTMKTHGVVNAGPDHKALFATVSTVVDGDDITRLQ